MPYSNLLFWGVLAYAAGIFFAPFFFFSLFLALFLLVSGLLLISVFWQRNKLVFAGVLFLAGSLGIAHYASKADLGPSLAKPQEVSFPARVAAPAEQDEQGTKLTVQAPDLKGKVLLFTSLFGKAKEGDLVFIKGTLQSPSVFEDFNYPLYLAKEGVSWVMFSPEIQVQEQGTPPFLSRVRNVMQEKIDTLFSSPESSLLSAMLLGNKAGLPEDLKADLNHTGTRHVTAISGMHVAILSGMLFAFLLNLGLARRKTSLLVLGFLIVFVAFTGGQASSMRAALMAGAFLASGLAGRSVLSLRTLVLAGGVLLAFNPLLLAHDAGFQLSFLAVLGILLLLPVLQHFLQRVPNPFALRDIALMSVAAQVFTLPVLLHHFDLFSLVSLPANLLIVPLVPLVLLGGIAVLGSSLLVPFLAGILAFGEGLLLSFISFVAAGLGDLPFAAVSVPEFPFWASIVPLLPLSWFAWRFQQTKRFQFREERMVLWR